MDRCPLADSPIVWDLDPEYVVVQLPPLVAAGVVLELHVWSWGDSSYAAWVTDHGATVAVVAPGAG